MDESVNSYKLSRAWFDFCFENPDLITPAHTAIYFFAIEHCNRLGWKQKFGFPTQMAMDAVGIKRHQTFIKYLNDLIDWGFIKMVEKSKNQWSANVIMLTSAMPKSDKALDRAMLKHTSKQSQSNRQSIDSIDKPLTDKPINLITMPFDSLQFLQAWNNWKEYKRKQWKFKYKSDSTEQIALNDLKQISKGIESDAIQIINKSITNGWKGLFELKKETNFRAKGADSTGLVQ